MGLGPCSSTLHSVGKVMMGQLRCFSSTEILKNNLTVDVPPAENLSLSSHGHIGNDRTAQEPVSKGTAV